MPNEMIDPQGYSDTATVFNKKKFYPGRALRIEGIGEEGDPIAGNFLIKRVNHDRMQVVDSDNKEIVILVEWLLTEIDHGENEEYGPCIQIDLYGEDRT